MDIPGGFSGVHRAKKQAYREAVGRPFRRTEYEWEKMPGTGNLGELCWRGSIIGNFENAINELMVVDD